MRLLLLVAAASSATPLDLAPQAARCAQAPAVASDGGAAPPVSRARAATEAIHQSGAVPRCWNAFLRLEPNANSVRIRIRVALNAAGAVERVVLLDPAPTNLADCVRTQVRRVTLPAGEPVTVETTYAFSPGATAPVPSR